MAILAGVERVVSMKINWLASHGYKVILVTYEQGLHPLVLPLHPNVKVVDLKTPFFTLSKYPLHVRCLKYLRMKSAFRGRLREVVNQVRPDIVLTIANCMNVITDIYEACINTKLIIESHETYHSVIKEHAYLSHPVLRVAAKLYDKQNLKYANRFDWLITLTKGDATEWRKHLSTNIDVIPNPLNVFPTSLEKPKDSYFRIIAAGRLEEVKGFDRLIKAFAMIADKCPQWRIDILGNGSCKDCLQAMITHYQLEDRVAILPSTKNIYPEYQKSDFYVLSSQHEGLGMVLLEAMSCGIPCVSFDCDYGPREIIDDEITGLLVEDGNIEKLAQAMLWMIEHHDERIKMGENARISVKKYQIDNIMYQWVDLFNRL